MYVPTTGRRFGQVQYTDGPSREKSHRQEAAASTTKMEPRVKMKKCSTERVNVNKGCDYCKMCYMKQEKIGTKAEKKKKHEVLVRMCDLPENICTDCWKSGYDKHRE